jgi:hypothetical protein
VIEAGKSAVAEGTVESLSAWVNEALHDKIRRDLQRQRLASAISAFEAEFGEISDDELIAQQRLDRQQAVVVRGGRRATGAQPA